jgi:tetratricopeptide (TPR) repeat protein
VSSTTRILPSRFAAPELVGRGGMGEIYLAHDRELNRPVAIKILDPHAAEDPDFRRRFHREALTAARLSGEPHVVTIFDVGEHEGRPFIVMEYLPGGTLAERARAAPPSLDQCLAWLAQAATALDKAHEQGVMHRDVKPGNLMLNGRDEVTVVDFGIARAVDHTSGMTAPGTVLGTAGYLAPEQAQGLETTAASDRYALGVVAYELLTGGRPFERGSATAEAAAQIHEPVPPASERGVGIPPAADAVFERALAKDPSRRYATATAFVDELAGAVHETPARVVPAPAGARRTARSGWPLPALLGALLGLALLVGVGVAAALLIGSADESPSRPQEAAPEIQTVTQEVTVQDEPTTVVQTITAPPDTEEAPSPEPSPESDVSVEEAAALNDEAFGSYMQQGDYESALPLLEQAVPALRGTYSSGFRYEAYAEYNLGKTLAELGRCGEALPHLERSEELQGSRGPITAAKRQCGG